MTKTIVNVTELFFFDHPGGVPRLATDLARAQARQGHRVYYICGQPRRSLAPREQWEGITIIRTSRVRHPSPDPRNMLAHILITRKIVQEIAREAGRIDVIHSHNPLQGLGAYSVNFSRPRPLWVHSIHSPWLMEIEAQKLWEGSRGGLGGLRSRAGAMAARQLEAALFRRVDLLTSDSEYTRGEITRQYPGIVSGRRFEAVPGWVDTERFTIDGPRTDWSAELGRKLGGPVFFTLRGLKVRNGMELLVEAAARLKGRGARFEVVIGGDGPLRGRLEEMIKDRSLSDCITLLGRVAEDKVPVLYRSCDFFVLPTLALECFGLIILEAFASGKPVIATPVGAIPELVGKAYPRGLLAETSADALAAAMMDHLTSRPAREQASSIGQELRRFAAERYSLELGTGRFLEAYGL